MSIAKSPESTELDPVVIEYTQTVERVRRDGTDALEGLIARLHPRAVRAKMAEWRKSNPCPDSDRILRELLSDEA